MFMQSHLNDVAHYDVQPFTVHHSPFEGSVWFLSLASYCEWLLNLDSWTNLSSCIFVKHFKSLRRVDRQLAFVAKNPPKWVLAASQAEA